MHPIIQVQQVWKTFRVPIKKEGLRQSVAGLFRRSYEDKAAVTDISFDIQEGEFVGFVGPNGAGKTTTIKMLSGIIHPDQGEVRVLGYVPKRLSKEFKKNFSVVLGQKSQLWWDLPACDSFLLYKEIYEIPDAQFKASVHELTELLDVERLLNVPVRNLSLGERMKFELITALLHRPRLVFLDEPTIGLDIISRRRIREFLQLVNRERKTTILLTSHYMEDIKSLCNRVIAIDRGRIIYDGQYAGISLESLEYKRVVVVFAQESIPERLQPHGRLIEVIGDKATYLVCKTRLKEFTQVLFSATEFVDFSIEDVPVDDVFTDLFSAEKVVGIDG